ncbi:MAG: DUF2945 domain-containing protein [Gemmatimonadaceae bacterium]|nr:DUF2945 domain-containing protein [Gemmatimonadaceae bacterium]
MPERRKTSVRKSPVKTAAEKTFTKDEAVSWKSSQGTIEGTVERTLTKPTRIKTHDVAASKDNPEILVRSDKTGALAAHKPGSLRKRGGRK